MKTRWLAWLCVAALLPAACGLPTEAIFPEKRGGAYDPHPTEKEESVFGPDGITVFGKTQSNSNNRQQQNPGFRKSQQ